MKKGITPREMENHVAELQQVLVSQGAVIFDEQLGEKHIMF